MPALRAAVERRLGLVLFLGMCALGALAFDDYGIAWDEPIQRRTGLHTFDYVFSDDQRLLEWKDQEYGVAFELPLFILEKALGLSDNRQIYLARHAATHLFFLLGALAGYKLILLLYRSRLLATIGFFMLVLHPRIYAHSFFNTKDIPFLSMFLICLYLAARALEDKRLGAIVLLGAGTGILVNLRIMGVLLPGCALLLLGLDAIREREYLRHLKLGLALLVSAALTLYVTWPFLWTDPLGHFAAAFTKMSRFPWPHEVLFNGELLSGHDIGWEYVPVWFALTTPVLYLALGGVGIALLLHRWLRSPSAALAAGRELYNGLLLACFAAPLVAVIALDSVLYDGWRQLYFIYPCFVLLAVYGLQRFSLGGQGRAMAVAFGLYFAFVGVQMARSHPFQHVYFNELLAFTEPEQLRRSFDLDYWGTSYRQSLEHILENDPSPEIRVAAANPPGAINSGILRPEQRERLTFVVTEEADYFVTNYRWHPRDYDELGGMEWHAIVVGGNTINEVFKLR